MNAQTLERLRKACRSNQSAEDAVAEDAVAELEANAVNLRATQTFAREAGLDFEKVLDAPAEAAAAFSRDVAAARSVLPKPVDPEVASDRRQYLAREIQRLHERGFSKAFTDELMPLLAGSAAKPNAIMLGRDDGAESFRGMQFVELLTKHGPPPPKGAFTASREVPRQQPGDEEKEQLKLGREQAKAYIESSGRPAAK